MTETEWLTCNRPDPLLDYLEGRTTDRKARLFAVACCRRVWGLIAHLSCRHAVEVAEGFADGTTDRKELQKAHQDAALVARYLAEDATVIASDFRYERPVIEEASGFITACVMYTPTYLAKLLEAEPKPYFSTYGALAASRKTARADWTGEPQMQAQLVRDIFGNPFRPVATNPSWLTSTVTALARAIYDDRAFDRLPILADALEDAGCTCQEVLAHCRGPGPHVRGCWVLDLLLGKE